MAPRDARRSARPCGHPHQRSTIMYPRWDNDAITEQVDDILWNIPATLHYHDDLEQAGASDELPHHRTRPHRRPPAPRADDLACPARTETPTDEPERSAQLAVQPSTATARRTPPSPQAAGGTPPPNPQRTPAPPPRTAPRSPIFRHTTGTTGATLRVDLRSTRSPCRVWRGPRIVDFPPR